MTIKDIFNFRKKKPVDTEAFSAFEFSRPEIPVIKEKKNKAWVEYGEDNNYPQFLTELLSTSAIHNAIVEGKAAMMAGKGFLLNGALDKAASEAVYNSLSPEVKKAYDDFIKNENGEPLEDIISKISRNYQKNGSFALELVYSMDWSRIATIKYVNTDNIRAGKMEADKVKDYWYSRDWTQCTKEGYKPHRIAAFDKENKEDYNQLLFVKNGTLDYYGEPSYKGAMSWIKIDSQMGLFHLSNIENGFNPSLTFKFYKKPSSPEEQQFIIDNIKKQWSGAKNTGKGLIFFSDGKELAPDVDPVQVSNIDKQFILLADQAVQQIMSGHKVTSPLLFGISVPGKLGGGTEIDLAYRIYDNSVVEPDRNRVERSLGLILEVNKIPLNLKIDKFNPLA